LLLVYGAWIAASKAPNAALARKMQPKGTVLCVSSTRQISHAIRASVVITHFL